ncbi:MAG TPA: response regulator [Verrucomicrobiota bacterium]|jgi:DNA-binding response OmpR family regulator|nr:response regulator [Verrucomicrobiota bacterium]OQB88502.1 MAG: Alkaline phosphatase synthesis transcriptional regulatory protein SphR [Verrucomicrobia bacterium ADurb.Bin118]HPY30871.1 response regulator [Verrucomicrobiota bacterium]HQB17245.1 response regulator [Verrucomicrobiota bacterium]
MSQRTRHAVSESNSAKPLIYAVDDEVMILEMISMVLEPRGYRVQTFSNPTQALRAFQAAAPRPELVIIDYAMHHINGMEWIAQCRETAPEQKLLLASGTVGEEIFADALVKPDRFLAKPFNADLLVATVRELVGR